MKRLRVMDLVPAEPAPLSTDDPEAFVDAWRQWHHLCQAIAEVGKSWGDPKADDSHSTLGYWPGNGNFYSSAEGAGVQAGWQVAPPHVDVTKAKDNEPWQSATLEYDGLTVAEVTAWVRAQAERFAGPPRQASVPAPDLPDHPVADGEPLSYSGETGAVYNHYVWTQLLLERLAEALDPEMTGEHDLSIHIWPHHFDLASLYVADRDGGGSMTKTIGVGLTPPDTVEASGYWYVSPWSKTELAAPFATPELPIGRWVDRGGVAMAVLPLSDVWAIADDHGTDEADIAQCVAVSEFVAAAFNACADAIGV